MVRAFSSGKTEAALKLHKKLFFLYPLAFRSLRVPAGDTLLDIAERDRLGFAQVVNLNPEVDVWVPPAGTRVQLPTEYILPNVPREGLVYSHHN